MKNDWLLKRVTRYGAVYALYLLMEDRMSEAFARSPWVSLPRGQEHATQNAIVAGQVLLDCEASESMAYRILAQAWVEYVGKQHAENIRAFGRVASL